MLTGSGAKAFVEQDHDSHITVHMNFLQGLNDDAMQVVGMVMQAHLAEHYALMYYNEMSAQAMQMGVQLPPPTFMDEEETDEEEIPPEVEVILSQVAAQIPPMQLMPPDEGGPDQEQAEFEAEEQRKQAAFEAEEERKAVAFEAEQERQDQAVDNKATRDLGATLTDEERKEEAHQRQLARDAERERRLNKEKAKGAA